MDAEKIDELTTQYFELGIVAGIEESETHLMDLAVEKFRNNFDDQAKFIKDLISELKFLRKNKREEYDKKYPKE